jgi:hypothetical protein
MRHALQLHTLDSPFRGVFYLDMKILTFPYLLYLLSYVEVHRLIDNIMDHQLNLHDFVYLFDMHERCSLYLTIAETVMYWTSATLVKTCYACVTVKILVPLSAVR